MPSSYKIDPITSQVIIERMPEYQKRERRAKKLREQQKKFQEQSEKAIELGGVAAPGHGPIGEVVHEYVPNYGGMMDKALGAIGSLYSDKKADTAEDELNAQRNKDLVEYSQQMSRNDPEPAVAEQLASALKVPPPAAITTPEPPPVPGQPPAPTGGPAGAAPEPPEEWVDIGEGDQAIKVDMGGMAEEHKKQLHDTLANMQAMGVDEDAIMKTIAAADAKRLKMWGESQGMAQATPVDMGQPQDVSAQMAASMGMPPAGPGGPSAGPDPSQIPPNVQTQAEPPPAPPIPPPMPGPPGDGVTAPPAAGLPPEAAPPAGEVPPDVATDQTLRMAMGMMGVDAKALGGPVRLLKTEKLKSGEIVNVYSDGTREKTGEFGDFNARTIADPDTGLVYSVGSSGSGRGTMTPVMGEDGKQLKLTPGQAKAFNQKYGEATGKTMGEAATREEAATTEATTRAAGKIAELSAEEKVSAATSLPKVQAATEKTTREVDRLLSDPGLDDLITGAASTLSSLPFGEALTNAYFGTLEKGSDAANAYAAHNVLTSVAFLQSYQEALKGTGAISNVEGLRAAQSNLQNALTQSPERYKERLEEFKQEVANVEQRVRDAAAKAVPGVKPTAPAAAPASNAIPPGWTFKVKGK